jgi:hypothetical protein
LDSAGHLSCSTRSVAGSNLALATNGLTQEVAISERSEALREAVGVFANANDLQAAIDELLSSGFHRAELSLLAGEDAMNEKLGGFVDARAFEDDPTVPRSAYVSPEAIGDAQGSMVGALAYAGATAAAGAIVLSGGTIVVALVAATLAGGAGSVAGAVLGKWLGDHHACYLQTQIDHGGLLLWVRTRDAKAEERALQILRKHSARDAHVHTLISEAAQVGAWATTQLTPERPYVEGDWNV